MGVPALYGGAAPPAGVGASGNSVGAAAEVLGQLVAGGGGVTEMLGLPPAPDVVAALVGGWSGMAGL